MGGHSVGKTLLRYRSRSSVSWAKSKIITVGMLGRLPIRVTLTSTDFGKHLPREVCKLLSRTFFKATKYFALRYVAAVRGLVKKGSG